MAFNVSSLSNFTPLGSQEIAVQAIGGATTIKSLLDSKNVQSGVKGTTRLLTLAQNITLTSASCGRVESATTTLSDKNLVSVNITVYDSMCYDALENTYYSYALANNPAGNEQLFINDFLNAEVLSRTAKVAEQNEILIWQGDTSITGTSSLNLLDGIVKQISGTTSVTGTSMSSKLQQLFIGQNSIVRNQPDFTIFVGQDIYNEYLVDMASKNVYHPTADNILWGTSCAIQVAPGLNGTRKAVASQLSNLRLAVDMASDSEKVDVWYDKTTTSLKIDYRYYLGIAVIFTTSTYVNYANV